MKRTLYTLGLAICLLLASCASPLPIKDNATVTDTLTMPEDGNISSFQVNLNIVHDYVGDLTVTLEHNGVTATLLDKLGCGAGNINATFSDYGEKHVNEMCDENPAISGTVIPQDALSVFEGLPVAGEWTLTITDSARANEGVLESWEIVTHCGFGPIDEGALMYEAKHVSGSLYQLTGNTKLAKDGEYCESGLGYNIDDVDGSFLGSYGFGFVRGQIEHEPETIWIVGHNN